MALALYGISNCDTCRRARRFLEAAGEDFQFVDVRRDGIDRERLEQWRTALGEDALINKRSKTWRDFDADQRAAAEVDPIDTLLAHPTLIKRPILETAHTTLAGFSAPRYDAALAEGH